MKIFDSYQEWKRHYRSIRDLIDGEDLRLRYYEPLSKISFPIIVDDGFECFGAMAFFTRDVKCHLHDGGSFKMNIGHRKYVFKNSSTDIDMNIRLYVERLLGQYYPVSEKFIEFEIDPSINTGIAELDLENANFKIEGGSYHLAFVVSALLNPLRDDLAQNIALTGKLRQIESGIFIIEPVENLLEKIYAVASYNIDKFFIPQQNLPSIKCYKHSEDKFTINKNGHNLEIIPVHTPVDVLSALYGDRWFELPNFRRIYDIKYMLQQEILKSNIVRIKNILSKKDERYVDIDNYVKLHILADQKEKKTFALANSEINHGDNKKPDRRLQRKIDSPIMPSSLIRQFGRVEDGKKILIVGAAGSGKSTLLRKLLFQLCNEEFDSARHILPVFLEIGHLGKNDNDFFDTVIKSFLNHRETEKGFTDFTHPDVYLKYIKMLDQMGNVIFLMDGYDELLGSEEVFKIGSLHNVIITSRHLVFNLKGAEKYEVQPLDDKTIKVLTHKYLKDYQKRKKIERYLESHEQSGFKHLFNNPLMLSLIVYVLKAAHVDISLKEMTKTQLLTKAFELLVKKIAQEKGHYFRKWCGTKPLELANIFYRNLAERSFYKSEIYEEHLGKELDKLIDGKEIKNLDPLTTNKIYLELIAILTAGIGILEPSGNNGYRFFHQVFHEYFVAKYVVDEISDNPTDFKNWINAHKFDQRYEMVFQFIAGFLDIEYSESNK